MTSINTEIVESNFSIALTDPPSVLAVSERVYELLGFKADDFLTGKLTLQSRIHPHDQDIADELFSTDIRTISGTFNIRLRHADSRIRCIKGQYTKVKEPTTNIITLELLLQDSKSLWQGQYDHTTMTNFKAMMENTHDYIYFKDRNHVFTGASQTLVVITDPSEYWTDLIGKTDYDVFSEEYADNYYKLEKQVFNGVHVAHEVQETLDNAGNKGWVDNRKEPIKNDDGEIIGLFGIARDITDRKTIESALKENQERLALATISNGVGIWDWDLQTLEMVWDDSMFSLYHIDRADFTGIIDAWERSLHPDDSERSEQEVQDAISGKKPFDTEFRVIWPNGEVHYIKAVAKVFRDENGKALRMLGTNIDITERKHLEEELTRQAHLDYLTGLSNRRHFMAQGEVELSRAIRYDTSLSALMLDIDFFKKVNDTYGHQAGDNVLQALSKVCQDTLRQVDIIGRIGGEEFAIILPETEAEEALDAAERLREAITKTEVTISAGLPIRFTVSIGVITLDDKNINIDMLLNQADKALYEAKETGRNKVCVGRS